MKVEQNLSRNEIHAAYDVALDVDALIEEKEMNLEQHLGTKMINAAYDVALEVDALNVDKEMNSEQNLGINVIHAAYDVALDVDALNAEKEMKLEQNLQIEKILQLSESSINPISQTLESQPSQISENQLSQELISKTNLEINVQALNAPQILKDKKKNPSSSKPKQTNYAPILQNDEIAQLSDKHNYRSFKHLLYQSFIAVGDHQPPESLFHLTKHVKNKKLLRWRMEICNFPLIFTYKRGNSTKMKLIDALSRITEPTENCNIKNKGVSIEVNELFGDEIRAEIGLQIIHEFQIKNVQIEFETECVSIDLEQLEVNLISSKLANTQNILSRMTSDSNQQTNNLMNMTKKESIDAGNISINRFMKSCMGKAHWNKMNKMQQLREDPMNSEEVQNICELNAINSDLPVSATDYFENMDHIQSFRNYLNRRKDLQTLIRNTQDLNINTEDAEVIFIEQQPAVADKWKWLKNDFDTLICDLKIDSNPSISDSEISEDIKELSTFDLLKRFESIIQRNKHKSAINKYKSAINIDELMKIRNNYINRIEINVVTRSQTRHQQQQEELIANYLNNKDNLITADDKLMKSLHALQKNEYPSIRKMIAANGSAKRYIKWCSAFEVPYLSIPLEFSDKGLLCYEERILVPTKLRTLLMNQFHNRAMATHVSKERMYKEMKKSFYWIDMKTDIYQFVNSCVCKMANIRRKGQMNLKDKGYNASYNVTMINQIVFYDLYGPTKHNNYAMVCGDLFDGCISCNAVKPIYSIDAIGIINNLVFEWIFRKGLADSFISDNGANVSNQLNRIFCWMWGINRSRKIFAYTPWANGVAEGKMRLINRAIMIERTRRTLIGVDHIYKHIKENINLINFDFMILCRTIEVTHNNMIQEGTGYSPNMIRAAFMCPSLLDIRMGLAGISKIKTNDYIKNGSVDFKKLMRTALFVNKTITKQIHLNKINSNREHEMQNQIKALQNMRPTLAIGDHVIYRGPPQVGKKGNDRLGFIIENIIAPKNATDKIKKKIILLETSVQD